MGVCCMEYLNQIFFDCLWGTCSSSIRRPRVAQCTRKLAQVTTLMTCILYVPLSGTPIVITESCCGFVLFCQTCRRAATTGFLSNLPRLFFYCHSLIRHHTRVGTLIVATIYLQLIQNRYMFPSFTVLQCSHQHYVQPVASDVEVVGYL